MFTMHTYSFSRLLLVAALGLGACSAPPQLEPLELGSIERLHGFGSISLAGQPGPEDLAAAAEAGLRTVIDLRGPAEDRGYDEGALAAELGLIYVELPFGGADTLTPEVFETGLAQLDGAQRPVLMHCGSANRVGALWLAWRALDGGLDIEEAAAEARTVGLRSPEMEQLARDYVAGQRAN